MAGAMMSPELCGQQKNTVTRIRVTVCQKGERTIPFVIKKKACGRG